MNSLNSVILEGELNLDPTQSFNKDGSMETTFKIASNRFLKDSDGTVSKEVIRVQIKTTGRLAETCMEVLKKGRGVRVVGRLAKDHDMVIVIAEHVEFKPIARTQDSEEEIA